MSLDLESGLGPLIPMRLIRRPMRIPTPAILTATIPLIAVIRMDRMPIPTLASMEVIGEAGATVIGRIIVATIPIDMDTVAAMAPDIGAVTPTETVLVTDMEIAPMLVAADIPPAMAVPEHSWGAPEDLVVATRAASVVATRAVDTADGRSPSAGFSASIDLKNHFPYTVGEMSDIPSVGQFEQLVLAAILSLHDNAYGVTIRNKVADLAQPRNVSLGAIYVTLDRLEDKGLISSWLTGPTAERGGRAKRCYRLEAVGEQALQESTATALRVSEVISNALGKDWARKWRKEWEKEPG